MFLSKIPNVDMLLDNMKNYVFMVFHFKYCISDIYIRIKEGSILISGSATSKKSTDHENLLCYFFNSTDH